MKPIVIVIIVVVIITGVLLLAYETTRPRPPQTLPPPELEGEFAGVDAFGGVLTLRYPADWAYGGDANGLRLASQQAIIDMPDMARIPSGELAVILTVLRKDMMATSIGLGLDASATDVLAVISDNIAAPAGLIPPLTDIQQTSFDSEPGAYALANGESAGHVGLVRDSNLEFLILTAVTAPGEAEQHVPVLRAILSSANYD